MERERKTERESVKDEKGSREVYVVYSPDRTAEYEI